MTTTTQPRYSTAKLTDEQVRMILERTDLTMNQLADLTGVSSSTVQKVRQGKAYAYLFPDIPRGNRVERITGPRCSRCVHDLRGACGLEFPERAESGDRAAVWCVAFAEGRVL